MSSVDRRGYFLAAIAREQRLFDESLATARVASGTPGAHREYDFARKTMRLADSRIKELERQVQGLQDRGVW